MDRNISYPGVGGSVAGAVGLLGIYAGWWETPSTLYYGTADISGALALAMSIGLGLLVFGAGAVLMSDPGIRRTMSALFTLCAVVLTLACVWGLIRTDEIGAGASISKGMWVSLLGGLCGIAAGLLGLRPATDASSTEPTDAQEHQPSDATSV